MMTADSFIPQSAVLNQLKTRWLQFTAISILALTVGFVVFWVGWSLLAALRWSIAPALSVAYLSFVLRRNLAANHRPGELQILYSLGLGNTLTLTRGLVVGAMAGFLWLPKPDSWFLWLPGILYIVSDLADLFDGYIARRTNHTTRLGEILDLSFDGLGVTIAASLAVKYGQVPFWYLAIAFARPLFLIGIWVLRMLSLPVFELGHNIYRRIFAGLQMGFLAVILLPIFAPPGTYVAAVLFGLPLLVGFTRDWFTVSGWWEFHRIPAGISESISSWLPLLLRLVILGLSFAVLPALFELSAEDHPMITTLTSVYLILVLLVFLGILPRFNAILALCVIGFFQFFAPLSALQILLAVAFAVPIYLGGGRLSIWNPEEPLFNRRLGENRVLTLEQQA